jgi:uncharacterized membrane protein (UPF0127 family)
MAIAAPAVAGNGNLARLTITTDTGVHVFHVEEALTEAERETGLMHRKSMPPDHGMLFRFPRTMQVMMWMKNTLIPLDMIFVCDDGTIAGIAADTTPLSERTIPSPERVRFVLELNAGTAAEIDAQPGDRVSGGVIGNGADK